MSGDYRKNRVSILVTNRDHDSDRSSEDQERNKSMRERPSTLQKSPGGGSARLTALSNMIQNYATAVGVTRISAEFRTTQLEDINKIKTMLKNNARRSSTVSLPSNWDSKQREMIRPIHDLMQTKIESCIGGVVWRQSEMHRMYEYIKEIAWTKLKADTMKKLQIIYNVHKSLVTENPDRETEFSPFGWTLEDFIIRRNENGTIWIDSLLNMSEKDLEMLKFKYDMEELFKILEILFEATKQVVYNGSETTYQFIENIYNFLRFPSILKVEAQRNMGKLHEQVNTYLDMLNFRRGAEEEAYKKSLEERLMDISVLGPIELRYEVNWLETKVDQSIMRLTDEVKEVENQIIDCNREQSKEMYCSRCALDMYYYDIESFKRRIAELSNRFEQEFEQVENEISYKTISLDKLHDQRKFLEEQIILFDEETQQLIQAELDAKAAEEELKRAEELRAQEAAMAKNKKKGKDKNKKK